MLGRYRKHDANVTNENSSFFKRAMNDHFKTLDKLITTAPWYLKTINTRRSNLYLSLRKFDYQENLIMALKYNPTNIKIYGGLLAYYFSLKKIKL